MTALPDHTAVKCTDTKQHATGPMPRIYGNRGTRPSCVSFPPLPFIPPSLPAPPQGSHTLADSLSVTSSLFIRASSRYSRTSLHTALSRSLRLVRNAVEVLPYKLEGLGFDSRCPCIYKSTQTFQQQYELEVASASNKTEIRQMFLQTEL
jgi:hypothetical protein